MKDDLKSTIETEYQLRKLRPGDRFTLFEGNSAEEEFLVVRGLYADDDVRIVSFDGEYSSVFSIYEFMDCYEDEFRMMSGATECEYEYYEVMNTASGKRFILKAPSPRCAIEKAYDILGWNVEILREMTFHDVRKTDVHMLRFDWD
jgi:hypothetical protein